MKNISTNFLYFRIDDKKDFNSYYLLDRIDSSSKDILIYNISKKVKEIDKKGKKALKALNTLLFRRVSIREEIVAYNNLDTFLVTTPAFRRYIHTIGAMEIESLKRTVLNSMIEKIYDNITKKRGVSNLRFALVLLKNSLDRLDNNLQSHIFYDIQNGVNINREVEKSFAKSIKESISQRELIQEIEPYSSNQIELLIKRDDERRFIKSFLKTLLSMHSLLSCDKKKIAILVGYMCYLLSTDDIKTTIRDGVEKMRISHSFMMLLEYQVKQSSLNSILILDEFLEDIDNQRVEEFLERRVYLAEGSLTITSGSLRQKNMKFLKNILIVGDFFRLVSDERDIESAIYSIQKKVLENNLDIKRYSEEPISSSFLKLFAKEYRKRENKTRLKEFFTSFKSQLLLQKRLPQRSISYSVSLASPL
jgi:hypothetical protein